MSDWTAQGQEVHSLETLRIRVQDGSVQTLMKSDPKLGRLIEEIGDLDIPLRTDYLASIVRSIIGQQISVSAASAIYGRLVELLGGFISADGLLRTSVEDLRQAGLTMRKAEYVKDLADKIGTRKLDLENIALYDDDEVLQQLILVKGIGKWTAEMFLILSLGRQDVLAIDDIGIQRAAKWLYDVDKSVRRQILVDYSDGWAPYRSIVYHYLWETIHVGFVARYDSFDQLLEQRNNR